MNLPDTIDHFLDALSHDAILDLNRRIQKRLHLSNPKSSHPFKLGDQVTFIYKGITLFGTVIRLNQKTVSVVENGDDKGSWKISPSLLNHIKSAH